MYLAIDIGGSKTLLACFDSSGKVVASEKFKTPRVYDEFLTELAKTVANLSTNKFVAVGVAIPGKVDRKTGVGLAFGNLPWQNVPVKKDIEKMMDCKVYIENDANLAGLSEARLIPEFNRVLYVTISTGIGGVIVNKGKIDEGTQDAEIGHILLEYGGRLVRWEDFASGKAIVEKFGKKASEIDPDDSKTWYVIARNIAIGLIDIIATLTPDVIIVGGGVGTHLPKYQDRLNEELKIYENPLIKIPPILSAKRPEEAVIYGCYELVRDKHGSTS